MRSFQLGLGVVCLASAIAGCTTTAGTTPNDADSGTGPAEVTDSGHQSAGDGGAADAAVLDAGARDASIADAANADSGARDAAVTTDGGMDASTPDAAMCAAGTRGCPCDLGQCSSGDVCDADTLLCRPPLDCVQASCVVHQTCVTQPQVDAVCLLACDPGYEWVPNTNSCDPIPSCDSTAPGSLVEDCLLLSRTCDASGVPMCGGCVTGFIDENGTCVANDCTRLDCASQHRSCSIVNNGPVCGSCSAGFVTDNSTMTCVDRVTCSELTCTGGTTCVEATSTTDAVCLMAAACPTGQVQALNGSCVDCTNCYDFRGGTPVPFTGVNGLANNGRAYGNLCVCDVKPGYFQDEQGDVLACDADGDGWVTSQLKSVLALVDHPLPREAECTVRKVDAFELVSDDADQTGEPSTRTVTIAELVAAYGLPADTYEVASAPGQDGSPQVTVGYVSLYEPHELDDPGEFQRRYTSTEARLLLHPYAGAPLPNPDGGTITDELTAAEANPLTRACNHDSDDLNLDSLFDVSQSQETQPAPFLANASIMKSTPLLFRMAYFIELARGYYRDETGSECTSGIGCMGRYVIQEKSRALGPTGVLGLELTYGSQEDPYWQECTRGRDPRYAGSSSTVAQLNLDFARWSNCASATGACKVNGHVPYDGRDTGLSTAFDDVPADTLGGNRVWPGMNHASQFKCITYANVPANEAYRRPPSTAYSLNVCALGNRQFDPPPPGFSTTNPIDPRLTCTPDSDVTAAMAASGNGYNQWAALKFTQYNPGNYTGGCIDESAEWGALLCRDVPLSNSVDSFGKIFCGCDPAASGPECEFGCPTNALFSNRAPVLGAVTGYWMCARPTTVHDTHLGSDGGYGLFGTVMPDLTPTQPQCTTSACDGGYRLLPFVQ